ncbi:hypothetical protein JCM30760_26030 [Thiomicrorhabdus hydrogeniphila]
MNILTDHDYQFASDLRRIIGLGGSPSDLQYLFPDYFGYDEANGKAKAARVHKNLMPKEVRVKHGRIVTISTLLRNKAKSIVISDFIKLCYPLILKAGADDNLLYLFLDVYETWLDIQDKEPSQKEFLNFQQAQAIFKFVVVNPTSYEPLQFKTCRNCNSIYPLLEANITDRHHSCPYCK